MGKDELQYNPLAADRQLGMQLAMGVASDAEILTQIDTFHQSGSRCASVLIIESGEFADGYVGDEDAIEDRFPFPQVKEAIAAYNPRDELCILIQCDNRVSAGIISRNPFSI